MKLFLFFYVFSLHHVILYILSYERFPILLLYLPHIMLLYIFLFYFSNTDQIFVIFKNEEDGDDDDLLSVSDQLNGVIFSIMFFW